MSDTCHPLDSCGKQDKQVEEDSLLFLSPVQPLTFWVLSVEALSVSSGSPCEWFKKQGLFVIPRDTGPFSGQNEA